MKNVVLLSTLLLFFSQPASAFVPYPLPTRKGGTGQDFSASTGYMKFTAGVASVEDPGVPYYNLAPNYLLNGAFDIWQRGTSIGVATGNPTYGYIADRWYIWNANTGATLTGARVTGVVNGSVYGMKATYGASATTNGMKVCQVLENTDSRNFYGQTASFTAKVLSVANTNQVGCQFYYATSETKLATAIGSEQTVSVSTDHVTPSSCTISGQAMGTAQGVSGVVGVCLRVTGVSSGNIYASGNGLTIEQAIMTLGSFTPTFHRALPTIGQELNALYRFYEKTYELATVPGASTQNGMYFVPFGDGSTPDQKKEWSYRYLARKRTASPTCTFYDTLGASASYSCVETDGTTVHTGQSFDGTSCYENLARMSDTSTCATMKGHVVIDAEI